MTYSVTRGGQLVIGSSTHDLTTGITVTSTSSREVDESYAMPTGKRRERQVRGSEITVQLRDATGARAELIMRAHDDGVAFRYQLLGEGESQVMSESTGFAIPSGARTLLRPYDDGPLIIFTGGAYEQPFHLLPLGTPTEATGFAFPALFELHGNTSYVMVTESDLVRSYCATRLDETPEGGLYRLRFPDEREGNWVGDVLPSADLPFMTPWRVIALGDLPTIVESTLVDDLSSPSVVDDPGWVRPWRAAWSWFSQDTGTPELQSGIRTTTPRLMPLQEAPLRRGLFRCLAVGPRGCGVAEAARIGQRAAPLHDTTSVNVGHFLGRFFRSLGALELSMPIP